MMLKRTLLIICCLFASGPAAFAQGSRPPASVFVEPVVPYEFSLRLEALGTLQANERVDLTLSAADRVTAIFFEDGDRVSAGKTLLSLAQREQTALVEAAEANVEEARRQYDRLSPLAAANAVSRAEFDAATRTLDSARANLRAVQSRQKDRVLVAPFDGVLGFRRVSVGSFIQPGTVVTTLVDDSQMKLDFTIPSIYLRALKSGTRIEARTDDFPDETFEGEVQTIDNIVDPVTRSVRVRAILPNESRLLKAGMFMKVTLIADPRTAPSVPEGAIESVGPESFVFVVDSETSPPRARRTQVQLGLRQAGRIEVLAGVETGEQIVTDGLIRIREGSALTIRDKSILSPDAKPIPAAGANSISSNRH